MRVLAAVSLGGSGHWEPMVPVLRACEARGDEVRVVGPPALRDMVEAAAFAFVAAAEPSEHEIATIREQLHAAPRDRAAVLGNRDLFGRLAARAMLPGVLTLAEWQPELILRDPCEYASAALAVRSGVTTAQIAISQAAAEWSSIDIAAPALEELEPGLTEAVRTMPYLTRMPAPLDPSRFASTIRYRTATPAHDPLPDWWHGSTAPLVYLTMWTVLGHMTIAARVYREALDAVAALPVRVLLTLGRTFDPAELGPVPPNVHVEAWVDQARVLPEADVVVCHGGSGTVFGALAAGVPVVVAPSFADQFRNGRTVETHGLGRVVNGPTDPTLRDAVAQVLEQTRFRTNAQAIAHEVLATPTIDEALDQIRR